MQRSESRAVQLLIIDDHEMVRMGLQMLLKRWSDIEIVGEAATAAAGIAECSRLCPDVVLMDMRLPDGTGVDACREIRVRHPETKVIFLTAFEDDAAVLAAVMCGADGYLLKEIDGEALVNAIQAVAQGRSILDPTVTKAVLERIRSSAGTLDPAARDRLSTQEQQILALVAEGRTNKQIAAALGLSYKTVKNYLSNIFQKIQVRHRSEAAAYFARRTSP